MRLQAALRTAEVGAIRRRGRGRGHPKWLTARSVADSVIDEAEAGGQRPGPSRGRGHPKWLTARNVGDTVLDCRGWLLCREWIGVSFSPPFTQPTWQKEDAKEPCAIRRLDRRGRNKGEGTKGKEQRGQVSIKRDLTPFCLLLFAFSPFCLLGCQPNGLS